MLTTNQIRTELARSIRAGRAILVLGPNAVTMTRSGQRVSLQTLLQEHLTELLRQRDPQHTLPAEPSLPYVAKALENTIFDHQLALRRHEGKQTQ